MGNVGCDIWEKWVRWAKTSYLHLDRHEASAAAELTGHVARGREDEATALLRRGGRGVKREGVRVRGVGVRG